MQIVNYIRARLFNSSNAALDLVRENPKHAGFAKKIVSVKQKNVLYDFIVSNSDSKKSDKAECKFNKYGFILKNISSIETLSSSTTTAAGLNRQGNMVKSPPDKIPVSTPILNKLNTMSVADTKKFCQILKQKMENNPSSINSMFRECTKIKVGEFNQRLTNPNEFLAEIKCDDINNIAAGFLIKKWLEQTLGDNKFLAKERMELAANKGNEKEINRIIDNKFNSLDANARENRTKFISLLSVMRVYKELSLSNLDMENRKHDPSVVEIVAMPLLFDVDKNQIIGTGSVDIASSYQLIDEAKMAFTALLEYRPRNTSTEFLI